MDISSFLSGRYLTHLDLPEPSQTWTIDRADQQLVGDDRKVCVAFAEFPAKALALNKTNLRRIADPYGVDATTWRGRQLLVYRSSTTFSGKVMPCVRVCVPGQPPPEVVCDADGNSVIATTPSAPQKPVASPSPWEETNQQNSPPGA